MKLLNIKTALLAGALALGLLEAACKKKEEAIMSPAVSNGTLMLHLHTNVDSNEVENYGDVYLVSNNRKISVSLAQLYIYGIQLVKADGSTYDLPAASILKVMEVEEYLVGSVPAGNYRSINFNVGLAPATDTSVPAAGDSTLNKHNMLFDAAVPASGHVFVNFQGKIDTSSLANGTVAQMQPFSYRIGTGAHVKTVVMPAKNYSVLPNQTQFIHLTIDYNKLFNGIQLNDPGQLHVNTAADNSSTTANRIASQIPDMFSYEE